MPTASFLFLFTKLNSSHIENNRKKKEKISVRDIEKHTARTPKTFMRKEPAAFNFSGDFPLEANSLSAYNYLQVHDNQMSSYYRKIIKKN